MPDTIHATAIALGPKCALIMGPSGSGKSDLALRCIMQPPCALVGVSAMLVSDDQVAITGHDQNLTASPPDPIAGLLEVRGLGLYKLPFQKNVPVGLVVQLTQEDKIERLPEPDATIEICGVALPTLQLSAFENSSHQKLLLALSTAERMPL